MTKLYKKAAEILNLREEDVQKAYALYWKFIKKTIKEIPIKEIKTEEELKGIKTYFNLSDLGKISIEFNKKQKEYYERYVQSKEDTSAV